MPTYAVIEAGTTRKGVPYAKVAGRLSASRRSVAERRATAVLGIPCGLVDGMTPDPHLLLTAWGRCKRWLKKAAHDEMNLATVYVRIFERATGKTVEEIKVGDWDQAWALRGSLYHNMNEQDYGARTVEKFEKKR